MDPTLKMIVFTSEYVKTMCTFYSNIISKELKNFLKLTNTDKTIIKLKFNF